MVQRFTRVQTSEGGAMRKDDKGGFVLYVDYQKLEAELEELRQQVKASVGGGWIEWGGGECPVPGHTMVTIKFRNTNTQVCGRAGSWFWGHCGNSGDIIAYRVVVVQNDGREG